MEQSFGASVLRQGCVSSASYYGDELRKTVYRGLFPSFFPATRRTRWPEAGEKARHTTAKLRGERVPVPGTTWVLSSPWLWRGGLAYWSAFRNQLRGA